MYVLPVLLTFDAGLRPTEAWDQIGRHKWRWVLAFLSAPTVSLVFKSQLPGLLVIPISFFYMAQVRSLLDVATGLAAAAHGRHSVVGKVMRDQQAGGAVLFGLPILVFLGIILWTGDARERSVALAITAPLLAIAGVIIVRAARR
jgi:hypothetical protein